MRRLRFALFSACSRLLIVCIALLTASTVVSAKSGQEGRAPVIVSPVQVLPIHNEIHLLGTVRSTQVAMLSTAIDGLVAVVNADVGMSVSTGDVLLELDAELSNLKWQSALATVERASLSLKNTQRRLREARALIPDKSIAESAVRDIEAEVEINKAQLQQAQADAKYQEAVLKRHRLRAPFDGVISRKLAEKGEWVKSGSGVFELVATDAVRLDFAVPEDYLARINLHHVAIVTLDARPGHRYQGRIHTLVPITDPNVHTFLLQIKVDNESLDMIPGMSARTILNVPAGRDGMVVPRDAVLRYPDGRVTVWVVKQQEGGWIAEEHVVRVGLDFAGQLEILSGITADARVVVQGNESLRNGQQVSVEEIKEQAESSQSSATAKH